MGACGSSDAANRGDQPTPEMVQRSRAIERLLREDEKRLAREVKAVIAPAFERETRADKPNPSPGPGSSGKSTILKQMKVIHLSGFTPHELESYRQQIFVNVRDAVVATVALMDEKMIEESDPSLRSVWSMVDTAPDLREGRPFPAELYFPIRMWWRDAGVQQAIQLSSEATIPENMTYFFTELERLFDPAYRPTDQDVLRCRQKTTGITETNFRSRDLDYRIFDVGGQRSERKKWIHCFEEVTAVLFLAAISGYDQVLLEDPDSNQMQEALMLFDSICNSQWFVRTSIILFLNKEDVLKERILVSPIRAHFPDYRGEDSDYLAARDFFKNKFMKLNRSTTKEVYSHFTTAIDTSLVKVVMTSVYDMILARNLEGILL
ncbi:hypothetical protein JCM10212_004537 [Sporobolomyces blumeae]